jgi:hypothetical protein
VAGAGRGGWCETAVRAPPLAGFQFNGGGGSGAPIKLGFGGLG